MKQLTCEMCGSTELLKQEGVFVCQTCGTKYSVEEAKKMMIEGTVEVQGTVKLDTSDKLENLYQLARRAKDDDNVEEAEKYYSMIICENPNDWEAAFYRLYFSTKNCTVAQMESKLYTFADGLASIFEIIKDEDHNEVINQIYVDIMKLVLLFRNNFLERAKSYQSIDAQTALDKLASGENCLAYLNIKLGDCYAKYDKERAIECYKRAITKTYKNSGNSGKYNAVARKRINELDPDYDDYDDSHLKNPGGRTTTISTNSGGCYVATCVYGSYDCPQVWTLRRYRDDTLGATWYGRLFIRTYYAISPTLVKWFGKTNWFKKLWKGKLDRMVAKLQNKGVENTPYEDKNW